MNQTPPAGAPVLLRDARVIDVASGEVLDGVDVLLVAGVIDEIGKRIRVEDPDIQVLKLGGQFVFPGLIDCHVHVTAIDHDLQAVARLPKSYVSAGAVRILQGMLARGFTTVRDVGGADWGLALAAADGSIENAPRLIFGGQSLSQTGGHGDLRGPEGGSLPCCSLSMVCDGVDEVRRAARSQLASGASHIKLMLGGGIASPLDSLEHLQFSDEEIRTAVATANAAGAYVTGHAYTSAAVDRAIRLGVRSIEHGNLIDEATAIAMRDHDTFYVPTLVTYERLADVVENGTAPEYMGEKLAAVREGGLRALELAARAGVRIAFGTDLLGAGHARQHDEFTIRSQVLSPIDLLRSATSTAAELLQLEGRVGTVSVGAHADLIISDLNPLVESVGNLPQHKYSLITRGRVLGNAATPKADRPLLNDATPTMRG